MTCIQTVLDYGVRPVENEPCETKRLIWWSSWRYTSGIDVSPSPKIAEFVITQVFACAPGDGMVWSRWSRGSYAVVLRCAYETDTAG